MSACAVCILCAPQAPCSLVSIQFWTASATSDPLGSPSNQGWRLALGEGSEGGLKAPGERWLGDSEAHTIGFGCPVEG